MVELRSVLATVANVKWLAGQQLHSVSSNGAAGNCCDTSRRLQRHLQCLDSQWTEAYNLCKQIAEGLCQLLLTSHMT